MGRRSWMKEAVSFFLHAIRTLIKMGWVLFVFFLLICGEPAISYRISVYFGGNGDTFRLENYVHQQLACA